MDIFRIRYFAALGVFAMASISAPTAAGAAATTNVPCDSTALITAINDAGAGDTLNLDHDCVYLLDGSTGPLPPINVPLTVHGNGSKIKRDPSAPPFRIFTVNADFRLDRVVLTRGDARNSPGSFGGAVAVFGGTTHLDRMTIKNNTATYSGGIGSLAGTTLIVSSSRIQGNFATINGGGAANDGTMSITDSVINNNTAGQKGGGLANDGTLRVTRSMVNNNRAGNVGGGIANVNGGTTILNRSTVNNNTADNAPGGIDNEAGANAVTLIRSNVRGNAPTNCSPTPVPGCVN
ncbi:hypothetical protein ABGB12_15545 [Actinocorallia sp. B10E7]|uniref:hypothetical protein n=1 Tax=Actinocorallia sp. B10E7 TaxID=3153558 RepID=UPI00325E270D